MKNPKVSVIVPNYNHSSFLKERIDSILLQTYQNFELIILDDCSTDHSVQIIENYRSNKHITHIEINEKNSGSTFLQWDRGVTLSQGEYIWIAESDDVADPSFLSTLVCQLEQHPEAVLAFSHSYLIDEVGRDLNIFKHSVNDKETIIVYDGMKYAHWAMLTCNDIYNASMVVFRRSIYERIDKGFQKYRQCGDWVFWMGACLQGGVIEVCQQLNYWRQHSNKVTVKQAVTGDDWREVASVLKGFISQLQLRGVYLRTFRGRWTRDFLSSHYADKYQLASQYPDVLQGTLWDRLLLKIIQRLFKIYRYN